MLQPLRRPFSALLIVFLPLAATFGCSRSATNLLAPSVPATGSPDLDPNALTIGDDPGRTTSTTQAFYPLALGDQWTYDRTLTSHFGLGRDALAEAELHSVVTRSLDCSVTAGPNFYISEHTLEQDQSYQFNSWLLLRQDAAGLYEADYVFTSASPCAPAGLAGEAGGVSGVAPIARPIAPTRAPDFLDRLWSEKPDALSPRRSPALLAEWQRQQRLLRAVIEGVGDAARSAPTLETALPEIQRLGYPLRAGSRWVTRADPLFTSRVLTRQRLRTPAGRVDAYKIRITSELLGATDYVYVWYGRVGFVGIISHAEANLVDENGIFAGWLSSDYREILTGYELQEPIARR